MGLELQALGISSLGFENANGIVFLVLCMGGSPDDVDEVPVMQVKQWKGWRMSCDVGEAMEGLGE